MTINEIGNSIRERRKMLDITQPDLAEMAQISINTLYKIERGEANPSIRVLNQIANILGLEISIAVKKVTDR
ncbi:helix-turn-helix transcriptional regulator [Echinicola sediminis]